MKILFLFPRWTYIFGVFSRIAKQTSGFLPLNIAYLAAIAEKAGHSVKIVDGEAEELTTEVLLRKVREFSPDLIGLTCTTPLFHAVKELASKIKNGFDIPIMVGGHHVSLLREKALEDCFDFLFVGESEISFAEFLECYEQGGDLSAVRGLLFRRSGQTVFTGEAGRIQDLDTIPFPARYLLRSDRYKLGTLRGRVQYTSIMMTRGCPFECIYCANIVSGRQVRRRSIKNVADEIEQVINDFGTRHFYFVDDILTLSKEYALGLCNEIDKRKLRITYEGSTRANLFDEELAQRLAKTGLIRISFGLESADPNVLKIIKKDIPLESYIQANRLTNKYGIETINSVMLGLPGEDRQSIQRTISFLCRAKDIHHATYSIAMPYPGTEFYEMARKGEYGLTLQSEDFSKYQRYGSAVLSIYDISPDDLLYFQKLGLLKIYLCPWRIVPMLKRIRLAAIVIPALSTLWELFRKSLYWRINRNIYRQLPGER